MKKHLSLIFLIIAFTSFSFAQSNGVGPLYPPNNTASKNVARAKSAGDPCPPPPVPIQPKPSTPNALPQKPQSRPVEPARPQPPRTQPVRPQPPCLNPPCSRPEPPRAQPARPLPQHPQNHHPEPARPLPPPRHHHDSDIFFCPLFIPYVVAPETNYVAPSASNTKNSWEDIQSVKDFFTNYKAFSNSVKRAFDSKDEASLEKYRMDRYRFEDEFYRISRKSEWTDENTIEYFNMTRIIDSYLTTSSSKTAE